MAGWLDGGKVESGEWRVECGMNGFGDDGVF